MIYVSTLPEMEVAAEHICNLQGYALDDAYNSPQCRLIGN
jgi:hypothetical protein